MGDLFVIDCGSRSIKLHHSRAGTVSLAATRSWDPLADTSNMRRVGALLADLTQGLPLQSSVHVVGTAAARRAPQIADAIAAASLARGWSYETLSHRAEADLIREAFGQQPDCDIVNAGGGSIQIVRPDGRAMLLDFGITDLNERFDLSRTPARRRPGEASAHVLGHLSLMSSTFIYSGGELSYLRALGASVDLNGRCTASEFLRIAALADRMSIEELERVSPFETGWIGGAVASNAIVRACLERSGAAYYYASDVNIADGIIAGLAGRSGHATDIGL